MTAQRNGKLVEIVAESRAVLYFLQRFLQFVSQPLRPLQGLLHWEMFRATCFAIVLRGKLRSVTAP